jgi:hypothetical protein
MSVFQDIIKGMADGAEALQANFAKLAKAISAIDDDGTIHIEKVSVNKLALSGDSSDWITATNAPGVTGTLRYKISAGVLYIKAYGIKGLTGTGATSGLITTIPNLTFTDGDRWGIVAPAGNFVGSLTLNSETGNLYLASTNGGTLNSSTFIVLNLSIPL